MAAPAFFLSKNFSAISLLFLPSYGYNVLFKEETLVKRIATLVLCALLLSIALCVRAESQTPLASAVVNNPNPADRLNLRVKPSTEAVSLGKFYNGVPVTVHKMQGDWAYVSLYKDFEGWMHTDYLSFGSDTAVLSAAPVVTVTAPLGKHLYDTMLASPSVSKPLMMGTQFEVLGVMEEERILHVQLLNGAIGFIRWSDTSYTNPK